MAFGSGAQAAGKRPQNLIAANWTLQKLARALVPREEWKPFPDVRDREAWEALPADSRKALVERGEKQLGGEWAVLPATLFLEFAREGNRSRYERAYNARRTRLRELVVAECAEDRGRFLDEISNGIWVICEETFWGVPAHLNLQRERFGLPDVTEPVVDLFAAETASQLAWTGYLLSERLDKVSAALRRRIHREIDRRILTPNFERVDFWWMGLDPKGRRHLNNWTPWVNSNWLTCVLIEETDGQRRAGAVHKIMRSLDRFLEGYHDDGGCDEGPSYWFRAGGSLFDCLELLHSATRGAVDLYRVPLIREIGRYIYRAHIAGDYVINFADASARMRMRGHLVFQYGQRIEDQKMQALGAWAEARNGTPTADDSLGRQLPALFNMAAIRAVETGPPLVRDVWLPGIEVMAARIEEGSERGLYLAAKGGHNSESHNHNDVGSFIVYAGGKPAIIDVGVETYTAKTFSSRRYEIWTMQSAYHNLPTVGGVMQPPGREFAATETAYRSDKKQAELSLNLEKAYPAEAGIASWRRTLVLDRAANEVRIQDRYRLAKAAPNISLTLMTPYQPAAGAAGEVVLGPVKVLYDHRTLSYSSEEIRIEDARLRSSWGERVYRVLLKADKPALEGAFTVRVVQPATA